MLDGLAQHKPLVAEAVRLGMPALAITDHGNMFGAYSFWSQCRKAGIKPVIGIEAYLAPVDRFHKKPVRWGTPDQRGDDVSGGGAFSHLTLLAEDSDGLRSLFKLSSLASIDGYYNKPRMDRELFRLHARNLIATTGCPSGEIQTRLRLGQDELAYKTAAEFQEIFGKDRYFLELMDHGLSIERRVRDGLIDIGRRLGIPPVATNDSHYVTKDQAKAHDALLAVQSGAQLDDPNRFKFDGEGYYVCPAEEMRQLWDTQVPGACDNTLAIADRVSSYDEVFAESSRMPMFPVPDRETQMSWLVKEVWRGMEGRFRGGPVPPEYRERVEYELRIIEEMGFPAYFLVVADLCSHARSEGIRVGPGRGSATGCMVAYALGITELDPIEHKLLFERFLNPERITMPDIDLDFDERRRGDMIRYVTDKWGADRVAQIITFGTIKAKAALKDAARIMHGQPGFAIADRISKAMPPAVMGKDISLDGIYNPDHPRFPEAVEVRGLLDSDPSARAIYDTALGLEGVIRQPGVHAAGVIISDAPLLDVIPIWARPQDGSVITGFDFPTCESIGLLKMDFLGLRNLTVIDDAVANVKTNRGIDLDLDNLPLADGRTFQLLARGDTLGVFQLDGGPMRALLRAMAPTKFEDIAAVLALYRPGPMAANAHIDYADRKNGRKPVVPIHPELAEPLAGILDETYGLIVYQEQVMAIAQKVAGYSLGGADLLRRAMGKKKKEILDKEFVGFAKGMGERGYSTEAIRTLWDILLPFAGYAFNKSHTAGYGIVSFWTAYLKANFPAEYMAALLTSVGDDKDKMAVYLAECRRMGITVLTPDVNASELRFTAVGEDIRFGLGAVRNVGAAVVESIVTTRKAQGTYQSWKDFIKKSESGVCNKRVLESLIKAGAFDSLWPSRRGLLEVHESSVDAALLDKRKREAGQDSLFDFGAADVPDMSEALLPTPGDQEWDRKTKLMFEREMLGLYVSSHPLAGAERILKSSSEQTIAQINDEEMPDGTPVVLAGMLTSVTKRITKQGKVWASATLEDLDGGIEVMFFPNTYELVADRLADDLVVAVRGRVNRRDNEAAKVNAADLAVLNVSEADLMKHPPVVLPVSAARLRDADAKRLAEIFKTHSGEHEVHIKLFNSQGGWSMWRVTGFRVNPSTAFWSELKTEPVVLRE